MLVRSIRPRSIVAPNARNSLMEPHNIHGLRIVSLSHVYPLQTIPAMINAAAARKFSIISAPDNTDALLITAVCESIRNCAPIRRISSKWLKRFSNKLHCVWKLVATLCNCHFVLSAYLLGSGEVKSSRQLGAPTHSGPMTRIPSSSFDKLNTYFA